MNIIFDLGGVVFDWNPDKLVNENVKDGLEKSALYSSLFEHNDWIELDRGTIEKESVVLRASKRSGLEKELISKILDCVPKALTPIQGTIDLFDEIKNSGHKLYVLSNMHLESAQSLLENNSFWHKFDGIVFSSNVKMVKPEKNIYHYIIDRYKFDTNKTIFIDDTKVNLDVAQDFGINTIHFKSPDQLKAELIKKGVI
ncbi:MAG: HAD family phosphatase [Spirochaetaceae bacterium]